MTPLAHAIRTFAIGVVATLALAIPALAGELRPWDADGFAAAQAEGRPVVVHVTAPWCPTCRAQKPVVEQLLSDPATDDLIVFEVDFDSQKDVLRRFNIRSQSTLVAWRGTTETGRTVGDTRPDGIAALFTGTL
ncbi:thioredoxin family protein [Devosia sp.]|uniref:thioredoxin family protein n=1 Tax=Devosia sp. TaxID=1871048 RepID=UPI003A9231A3